MYENVLPVPHVVCVKGGYIPKCQIGLHWGGGASFGEYGLKGFVNGEDALETIAPKGRDMYGEVKRFL